MTKWWFLAFVIWTIAIAYVAYSYGNDHSALKCAKGIETQQQAAIASQKAVIATVAEQQTVTQGVDHAYELKKTDIDNQYVSEPASVLPRVLHACGDIRTFTGAASRLDAPTPRPLRTKVYKLSAQECDENTEQLYGLQAWERGQQKVKQPGALAH